MNSSTLIGLILLVTLLIMGWVTWRRIRQEPRRLANAGWIAVTLLLGIQVMASVFPTQVELRSVRWSEGDPRRASLRDVRVAIGEVDWFCTGDAATSSLIDRLLQVGELTGIGARTAWGTGALEIADRIPMRVIAAGNKSHLRRGPSRPSGIGGAGRTPSPRTAGEPGEWGFDDERPGGSRDRRFGSE